ncbi:chaperone modulator CbpM [Vibrio parahaemolyticus]
MTQHALTVIDVQILEQDCHLSLAQLCHACQISAEHITELVDYGILSPQGPSPSQWLFTGECIARIHRSQRLQRDLHINLAGIALVLELLEEQAHLRQQLHSLRRASST